MDNARVLNTPASSVDRVQLVVVSDAACVSTVPYDAVKAGVCAVPSVVEQVVSMGVGVNDSSVHVELYSEGVVVRVVESGVTEFRLELPA